MLPSELQPEQFGAYPPQARAVAVARLAVLRQLPVSFLPSLLREVIEFDFKFPVERSAIEKELENLGSLTPKQMHDWFDGFEKVTVSSKLEQFDWINQPAQFTEQLSAYLWSTHQLDTFRKAATDYGERLQAISPPESPPMRRLGIAIIGQGVSSYDGTLFRYLRQHGTYFNAIKPENGVQILLAAAASRAEAHPVPYAHWYVDGGQPADYRSLLTCVSYKTMEPVRNALLRNMQAQIKRPGMGPEELRTHMAKLSPSDLGMNKAGDPVLDRFRLKILTEGSGTQIFSTTFAQWTTREVLRRAQAVTLVVRYAPRQRQRPMNELLSSTNEMTEPDLVGSLIDSDMAAYYHWLNQQRLPGHNESSFLVWFEGHNQALVVAPTLPRGTSSNSTLDLNELLKLAVE
jgi:hypothetical protein